MKRTRRPLPAWVAAALLLLSPLAQAQAQHEARAPCDSPAGGPPPMPPLGLPSPIPSHIPPHILERLMLSEEQQDKVFALLHAQAPRQRTAAKTAAAARDQLWQLVEGDRYDSAQAQKLAAAHGQAVAALLLLQAEADAGVRALLTPDQRARLARTPEQRARPARPADPGH